jgi:hypothetical protein
LSVFFRTEDPACLLFFHFGNFLEAADIAASLSDVCFTPESGHVQCNLVCPLSANSGHACVLLFARDHQGVRKDNRAIRRPIELKCVLRKSVDIRGQKDSLLSGTSEDVTALSRGRDQTSLGRQRSRRRTLERREISRDRGIPSSHNVRRN